MTEGFHEPIDGVFTDLGAAEIVPPNWIIEDLLPPGLVFIGAPPKANKSTLTLALATLAAGHECRVLPRSLSIVRNSGPALLFSYEASAGELRHMAEIGMDCRIPTDGSILVSDDPFTFRLDDPNGVERLLFWLRERDPRVCVLDPLRDFHNQEEKDSGAMNRMLRPLRQWAVKNNSALVVVHHTRKRDPNAPVSANYDNQDMRGSGALFGIADAVLMLTPLGEGKLSIKATFKRAKGWERTIRPAWYENVDQPAMEILSAVDELVRQALVLGASDLEGIAKQIRAPLARVKEAAERLRKAGIV